MKSSTNCARECGSVGEGGCRCMCARKILKNTVVLFSIYFLKITLCLLVFGLFVLRRNGPVNNFSVMSGRSQLFLGLTSTVGS